MGMLGFEFLSTSGYHFVKPVVKLVGLETVGCGEQEQLRFR